MKKLFLICLLSLMLSGCLFHFVPTYKAESKMKVDIAAIDDFNFNLDYPGDITGKRFVLSGEEGRWIDILEYNRVIGFVKQRNQLRDTGELLIKEHTAKVEAFNLFVKDYNVLVDETNTKETQLTVWTYLGTGGWAVTLILLLIILL